MRALCWEDCLWILLSQGPTALSGFYQEYWWGSGNTVEFRERCPWPGASSTNQAGVDNSVSLLGYRQPVHLTGYPAICSQHPGSHQALVSQGLLLKAQEGKLSWSKWWEMAEGQVASVRVWRILRSSYRQLLWLLCLGLQFTNEIKMPTACLYTHLLRNTLAWTA